MGQKINPIGFRLAVNKNWGSRWYASNRAFAGMLAEDIKVRGFLKRRLSHASVGRVLIERPAKDARITIYSARPGVVIGKKGEEIESLKAELRRIMGVQQVHVNIEEIRKPEIDAQLIADSIAQQLEKRIMFRRAMKRAIQNAMRLGAQGIKIMSAGRLNGVEISRTEWYREGRVPLHTLRADIDYGVSEAKTTYGVIGIKVWVYRGDVMPKSDTLAALTPAVPAALPEEPAQPRKPKKPAPKLGARRAPAKDKGEGEAAKKPSTARATARKTGDAKATAGADAADAKPKTAVKRTRKTAKDAKDSGAADKKE